MRSILTQLNKTQGVWGSMIVGRDGILIAADFSVEAQEAQMAAIASQMLVAVDGALKRIGMGNFKRFVIGGSDNKLVIVNAGQTILMVLLKRDVNMGLVNLDIKQATDALISNSKL